MGAAIIGFFGSAIAAVVSLFGIAAGLTALVIAWKAGLLPVFGEAFLIVLRGFFIDLPVAVFGFFRDLIAFATS